MYLQGIAQPTLRIFLAVDAGVVRCWGAKLIPATKGSNTMRKITQEVLEGFEYMARRNGRVARIYDIQGDTVAEVVAGKRAVRVNFKTITERLDEHAAEEGLEFTGNSSAWEGGLRVTAANLDAVRRLIRVAVDEASQRARRKRNAQRTLEVLPLDNKLHDDLIEVIERLADGRPELEELSHRLREARPGGSDDDEEESMQSSPRALFLLPSGG